MTSHRRIGHRLGALTQWDRRRCLGECGVPELDVVLVVAGKEFTLQPKSIRIRCLGRNMQTGWSTKG